MALKICLRDRSTGEELVHAVATHGNYATLCGCSDDDDEFEPAQLPNPRAKIECSSCRGIFEDSRRLRVSDFSKETHLD